MLRAIRSIWHGDKDWSGLSDITGPWRKLPYGLLLAGLIAFGCFPRLLTDDIAVSAAPVARQVGGQIPPDAPVMKGPLP
jgi:hypothetical protein